MHPHPHIEPRALLAAARRASAELLIALLSCAAVTQAQYGTIQRDQKIASSSGNFAGVLGNDYRFGVSVADLGDFDGDGIRDLVVGGHRANIGGAERGAIWLLLMNANGTVKQHTEISGLAGGLQGPLDDHDRFGISVCSLGDLDLDGTTDIAVGCYRDDDGGMDFGAVYMLFLNPNGSVKREQKISALSGGFTGTLHIEDSFGWSVENIGDLDGDGVIDLAVGATRDDGDDPDPVADFGAVYVLFLNQDGTVKANAKIGVGSNAIGPLLRPSDRFGGDVVLLDDADGDGVEDIAVGAFGDEPLKYGEVFVLHLNTDGTVKSVQQIGAGMGGFTGVLGHGDRFGISLAAHDLDGDGRKDLFIGAAGDDDGGADAGAVWMCLLDAQGRVRKTEKISADFGGFSGLLHPGDNFGISVAVIGDLDRDGAVDLAVGSYQDDEGGFDRGATWILFRAGTGLPVADFVSTPTSGIAPLSVQFTDRSSGSITRWQWDFGDGQSSTQPSPVHVYGARGVYDVRLTVSGALGSDTLLRQRAVVTLVPTAPDAHFSALPSGGPAPLSVAFVDQSTGSISSWSWDFGDGASSTLRNTKHVFAALGSYTVSLTVTGSLGTSTLTEVDLVHVTEAAPTPAFTAAPTGGVAPLAVQFTDQSVPEPSAWMWDFGDGTSATEPAPLHVYSVPGSYTVALTVTGVGGSNTLTRAGLVRVEVPLRAHFDFTPRTGGLPPLTVQFTDLSSAEATSFAWDFADGTTSSERNPAHVFHSGGFFPVTLTVTGANQTASETQSVEVTEPPPFARFSATPRSGAALLGVHFSDLSIGNITSWEWDFGDGTRSSLPEPLHGYAKPGVYTVRFRVHSAGGVASTVHRDYITVTDALPRGPASPTPPPAPGVVYRQKLKNP